MVLKKTTRSPKTAPPVPSDAGAAARGPRRTRSTPPKAAAPTPVAETSEIRVDAQAPAAAGRAAKGAAPKRPTPGRATSKSPARTPAAPQPAATAAPPSADRSPAVKPVGTAGGNGSAPRVVTDEDIRVRAYFLSIEHRGQGSPEYFWMLAERELRRPGDSQ